MAFESLSNRLNDTFRKWTKRDRINEKQLEELLAEVRSSLLDADVALSVIDDFSKTIYDQALGQKILSSLNANEALMKIIYDALVELLGPSSFEFEWPNSQKKIFMLVGLQGSGKTTSAAKLAYLLKKSGKKPLLVGADTQRPAAKEQLRILAKSIDVDFFTNDEETSALKIVNEALKNFKASDNNALIVDTAGRLHVDEELMNEVVDLSKVLKADEILLSVDAMSGQDVIHTASAFKARLDITGLVVTKFDSDAKGGAVLSVKALTKVPVKLVGTGEKVEDVDVFYPDRMANRIIGMGDLMSLVEQAQDKMDQDAAERSMKRMMEGVFTFDDMLTQFNQLSKMGSLKNLMGMLPGMGQMAQQVNDEESQLVIKVNKAIIHSMTKEEREDASLLRASRKNRIALGAGVDVSDVNRLIRQYEKSKEQMRHLKRLMKNNPNI